MSSIAYPILSTLGVDRFFRHYNRDKILILSYHGISRNRTMLPPHTLIPEVLFDEQIKYLSRKYNIITLRQAVKALNSAKRLNNTAVITFDDGYRNNFTLALPILEKYNAPATVFVTAGYIGSKEILPLDEAYVLISQAKGRTSCKINEINLGPLYFESDDDLCRSYREVASFLKQLPCDQQKLHINLLKLKLQNSTPKSDTEMVDDFLLLSKDELRVLAKSEIIDIGAHTVNHQILSKVDVRTSAWEIIHSKFLLQNYTGRDIDLFAYPNGGKMDFNDDHIAILKDNGFICSVTLESKLNVPYTNPYRLGRICIGPDFALNTAEFAMKTSGCISAVKSFMKYTYV
jgi:peptidoglycan/xylan/chitin deacetylase (PgdA/CDA1 family)